MSAKIIKESENLKLERVLTVSTDRGDEYVINADRAVCALAEFFSDVANERRAGWHLNAGWYEAEFRKLFAKATGAA